MELEQILKALSVIFIPILGNIFLRIIMVEEKDHYNLKDVRIYISILFILIIFISGCFMNDRELGPFFVAMLVYPNIFWFLLYSKTVNNYVKRTYNTIKILFLKRFYWKNENCIIEMLVKNKWINIYCIDKINYKVSIIKETDNSEDITSFMRLLYENFYDSQKISYQNFVDFSKSNQISFKEFTLNIKNENYNIKNVDKFLKEQGINTEIKKIKINTATEIEIVNLPIINIIMAKKIKKHLTEKGFFKDFWEFANFVQLTPNQGLILSELIIIEESSNKITKINKNEYKIDRTVDI